MSRSHFTRGASHNIERPTCPKCSGRLWLAGIEPSTHDVDQRTFRCPECAFSETVLIKFR